MRLDDDATDDVVCLLTTLEEIDDSVVVGARIRVYTASTDGALTERTTPPGFPIEPAGFLLRDARWVGLPADGDHPATIVGVDGIGRAVAVELACDDAGCDFEEPVSISGDGPGAAPLALRTADLDSDGDLDVIGAFRNRIRIWFNDGGFTEPVDRAVPDGLGVADAAAIDLELDGVAELTSPEPWLAIGADVVDASAGITLVVDDLDRDGLPDLVMVSGLEPSAPRDLVAIVQREARITR
jgi:hypothetical protein